ncbi:MAG: glutaminase A [Casimicrobiaceae bacterium]
MTVPVDRAWKLRLLSGLCGRDMRANSEINVTTLPLQRYLTALHEKYSGHDAGKVATYIPELANADPAWLGVCIVTADGYVYSVGDSDRRFTIQSISKPMVYAAALADRGRERVLRKVGVEPSGEAFNSISLDPQSGAPPNPMINAGAIATTGLVSGANAAEQWNRIADVMGTFFGRDIDIDEAVYRSESETGYRNRAIAWMLKNFGIIDGDPMLVLENYFRQCSVGVTCRDLAFMAATFANNGVHPLTGRRAVPAEDIEAVLSIMATCGMYDYAGSWLYDVGLPAKSGVSGGVIAVMPGRFGIAVFSPPLDENGNSTRGLAICRQISRDFRLHAFGMSVSPALVLGRVYTALDAPSRRVRSAATATRLRLVAARIKCVGLQGDVAFDGAEFAVRSLMKMAPETSSYVLDMSRVSYLGDSAARLFHDLGRGLAHEGKALVYSRIRATTTIEDALRRTLADDDAGFLCFEDNDVATEWCENRLLETDAGEAASPLAVLALSDFPLFASMDDAMLARLQACVEEIDCPAGATIIMVGQMQDDRVFFIVEGEVSVVLSVGDGSHQRIATLSRGMSFGEMALLGQAARSASVFADTPVRVWALRASALDDLRAEHPDIMINVLKNLSFDLAQKLRQANKMIGALAS